MSRFFNIAGPCIPNEHYMVPVARRASELESLVRQKQYFVLHAPRQTGKTTLIRELVSELERKGDVHAIYCTLETAQDIGDPDKAMPLIIRNLEKAMFYNPTIEKKDFSVFAADEPSGSALNSALSRFCAGLSKPLVIMFDEVDCLRAATLISFLRQLRQGYVERGTIPFVHSIGLTGMRNIRDFKARVRDDAETLGSASPFNIITKALTVTNFDHDEVKLLLGQHREETGQIFPPDAINEIMRLTNGQPWLVNALAREIVTEILNDDTSREIWVEHVATAAENIILRRDTHIDSLLERLKEERVRRVVEPVLLGDAIDLDFLDNDARYVFDLGLLDPNRGDVKPANPIYGEVIMRILSLNSQYHLPKSLEGRFITGDRLDIAALLREFQQFWRENSDIWVEKYQYREAAPHLILQAFFQRVLNGCGRIHREYSAGRGRIDLCLELGEHRYAVELKIRYREDTVMHGIEQLGGYLEHLGLSEGWLVVFDRRPEIPWDERISWQTEKKSGRTVHIVGC